MNQICHAIKHCQNIYLWKSTRIEPSFLPFDEPNSCNDCIFMDQKYYNWFHFLNQADSSTDLFDKVLFERVVVRPTDKPRSVGSHKSKTTMNKNKSRLKDKKFRSVITQLHEGSIEPNSYGTNILQKHLFYKNKDPKNYPFIDIGTSILNITWKLTKNHSHIISDRLFSVIHCILGIIRGPNLMLNHQA